MKESLSKAENIIDKAEKEIEKFQKIYSSDEVCRNHMGEVITTLSDLVELIKSTRRDLENIISVIK